MQLHIFVFDEELKSLRGFGTPIDILPFYNPGVSITNACFVHGSEEILFRLERPGEDLLSHYPAAQVYANLPIPVFFSMLTLHCRPASLQLAWVPRAIYSAPDGSCVLVVEDEDGERNITAYRWSTFAATRGITITLPDFPVDLDAVQQCFSRQSSIGTTSTSSA
jgi:hypothetical protein